jgi:hypothetical protein
LFPFSTSFPCLPFGQGFREFAFKRKAVFFGGITLLERTEGLGLFLPSGYLGECNFFFFATDLQCIGGEKRKKSFLIFKKDRIPGQK